MECPECGYDAEDAANFCPQCRHEFKEPDVEFESLPSATGTEEPSSLATPEKNPELFSRKELQHLRVHLLQPSMLMTAGVAITGDVTVPQVRDVSFNALGQTYPAGGALCVIAGIVIGALFYGVMSARARKVPLGLKFPEIFLQLDCLVSDQLKSLNPRKMQIPRYQRFIVPDSNCRDQFIERGYMPAPPGKDGSNFCINDCGFSIEREYREKLQEFFRNIIHFLFPALFCTVQKFGAADRCCFQ